MPPLGELGHGIAVSVEDRSPSKSKSGAAYARTLWRVSRRRSADADRFWDAIANIEFHAAIQMPPRRWSTTYSFDASTRPVGKVHSLAATNSASSSGDRSRSRSGSGSRASSIWSSSVRSWTDAGGTSRSFAGRAASSHRGAPPCPGRQVGVGRRPNPKMFDRRNAVPAYGSALTAGPLTFARFARRRSLLQHGRGGRMRGSDEVVHEARVAALPGADQQEAQA